MVDANRFISALAQLLLQLKRIVETTMGALNEII